MSNFEKLSRINVNEHTEEKNGLTYLSWAWAWSEFKKACPDAHYQVWKDADGKPYVYDDKLGYMVMVEVTAGDETHSMWLPVMDGANKAMKDHPYQYTVKNSYFKYAKWDEEKKGYYDKYGNRQEEYLTKKVEQASMFDINTAIMRCLTKCLAMFGLGLYIYAGEDLPHVDEAQNEFSQWCKKVGIAEQEFCRYFNITSVAKMDEQRINYFRSKKDTELVREIKGGK